MIILLPPSESKNPAHYGKPVNIEELSFPFLSFARKRVMRELETISKKPDALSILGVGNTLQEEVKRNTLLKKEPTAPAYEIYSGVLYDALSYATLPATDYV